MSTPIKILSFALLFLFSCENDFDVTGEWEEIMVLNSILDPSQPEQYIKITKAFLNKNRDAYDIAKQNPDSIYYPDVLEVSISQLGFKGEVLKTYKLTRALLTEKDSGIFSADNNYIYKVATPEFSGDYKYQVSVTNTKSGKTASAVTPIIQSLCIKKPAKGPFSTSEHCSNNGALDSISLSGEYIVQYYTAKNATLYEILIDFTYYDYYFDDILDTHVVRWQLLEPVHKDYAYLYWQFFSIPKDSFFIFLRSAIPFEKDPDGLQRKAGPLDFTINAASMDIEIYKQLLSTSKTLTQSIPDFTNVKGGVGIIASRNHRTVHIKKLFQETIDTIYFKYPELKFKR